MTHPGGTASGRRGTVLVVTSTFPASPTDPVPAFVRDQVVALHRAYPDLVFDVLAPHDHRSGTRDRTEHEHYTEHRFRYMLPRRAEVLAGRGIMPALTRNRMLYLVVPFLFLGELLATWRLTRRLRPDVLYVHWFTPQAVVAAVVSRFTGVPFVFTTHASDVDVWRKVPVIGPVVVRATARRAAAASAVSRRTLARLQQFGGAAASVPVHVIPMGTDQPRAAASPDDRTRARRALGLEDDVFTCLFVGRLVPKKGVDELLEAMALLDDGRPWHLLVAGDGPVRAELEAHCARLGLGGAVTFLGHVAGEDKQRCFAAADVVAVPSVVAADGDAEGLPVVVLESIASGVPCVATHESGADDILEDGRTGFLVPQRDHRALAGALERVRLLAPDERSALQERALELSRSFSWAHVAERHHDALLAAVLERARATGPRSAGRP